MASAAASVPIDDWTIYIIDIVFLCGMLSGGKIKPKTQKRYVPEICVRKMFQKDVPVICIRKMYQKDVPTRKIYQKDVLCTDVHITARY